MTVKFMIVKFGSVDLFFILGNKTAGCRCV